MVGGNPGYPAQRALEHLRNYGWVSLRALCDILGLSYPTVMKYKKAGKISYIQMGGTCRVHIKEVQRLLRDGTESPSSSTPTPTKADLNLTLNSLMPKAAAHKYRSEVDKIRTGRILAGLDFDENQEEE